MGQTIKGLIALSVSTIVVHAIYTIIIRPKAMMMEALAAQGQPEMTRSIWIILKDFEQEVCLILKDSVATRGIRSRILRALSCAASALATVMASQLFEKGSGRERVIIIWVWLEVL